MLEAIDLTKRYGAHTALDHLDLRIEPGDIYCLLGANGAGKTTTINLFLNFIDPSEGRAAIDGMDVTCSPLRNHPVAVFGLEHLVRTVARPGQQSTDSQ